MCYDLKSHFWIFCKKKKSFNPLLILTPNPSHFGMNFEINFEFWDKSCELWKFVNLKFKIVKKWFFDVFWNFTSRNEILSISSVSKCENWSKRVIDFKFKVFSWIWCSKLEIYKILACGLTLVNICGLDAWIGCFHSFIEFRGWFSA